LGNVIRSQRGHRAHAYRGAVIGYDVLVNRPKTAAYRAPGATNAAYAAETAIDELAEKCRTDPIDFRLNNAVREGTPGGWG
jgi:CO/xanthine dehydrogenase Mo-binding subunit